MYKIRDRLKARRFARKTMKVIKRTLSGMDQEAVETSEMMHSFFRLLESKLNLSRRNEPPTEEELKAAIDQLIDVGRFSVFAGISIIPGGGFSLIGLEYLARKFGIRNFTLLPSSFRKMDRKTLRKIILKKQVREELKKK